MTTSDLVASRRVKEVTSFRVRAMRCSVDAVELPVVLFISREMGEGMEMERRARLTRRKNNGMVGRGRENLVLTISMVSEGA